MNVVADSDARQEIPWATINLDAMNAHLACGFFMEHIQVQPLKAKCPYVASIDAVLAVVLIRFRFFAQQRSNVPELREAGRQFFLDHFTVVDAV
jgi:hypothetical protein